MPWQERGCGAAGSPAPDVLRRFIRLSAALGAAALSVLIMASPAAAHAVLVSSSPVDGQIVKQAPPRVIAPVLWAWMPALPALIGPEDSTSTAPEPLRNPAPDAFTLAGPARTMQLVCCKRQARERSSLAQKNRYCITAGIGDGQVL